MLLNGVDLTSTVKTQPGKFSADWQAVKIVGFAEPKVSAVLAFKGSSDSIGDPTNSGLMLRCSSTRKNSPWNFTALVDDIWKSVPSSSNETDSFPADWFLSSYTGDENSSVLSTATFSLAKTETCLTVPSQQKIATPWRSTYFTFRRFVIQDCATSSPLVSNAPSQIPSQTPASSRPSKGPSKAPSSSRPSQSPTTSRPSHSPSLGPLTSLPSSIPSQMPKTSKPSTSPSHSSIPSKVPTVFFPSQSPSSSRPSLSPSRYRSPSHAPTTSIPSRGPVTVSPTTCVGRVTCCVSSIA